VAAGPAHLEADFTLLKSQFAGMRKRAATRYKCNLATLGHLTLGDGSPRKAVWAANLSESGIGFFCDQALEPGTCVIISLARRDQCTLTLKAKVVHCTERDKLEWLVGCEFATRLEAETLDDLL
jgi:hypothetical protein